MGRPGPHRTVRPPPRCHQPTARHPWTDTRHQPATPVSRPPPRQDTPRLDPRTRPRHRHHHLDRAHGPHLPAAPRRDRTGQQRHHQPDRRHPSTPRTTTPRPATHHFGSDNCEPTRDGATHRRRVDDGRVERCRADQHGIDHRTIIGRTADYRTASTPLPRRATVLGQPPSPRAPEHTERMSRPCHRLICAVDQSSKFSKADGSYPLRRRQAVPLPPRYGRKKSRSSCA